MPAELVLEDQEMNTEIDTREGGQMETVVEEIDDKKEIPIIKADNRTKIADFGLDATSETMSVAEFMNKLDVFKFNDPIQRGTVWNIAKKSLLIVSILQNVYIGQFMVQIVRKGGKKYRNVLDGKQRLTTIRDYIKGKYALEKTEYINGLDEDGNPILIDVNGLKFEELPEAFQERLKALVLEFRLFEVDDSIKSELFYRWNNGEALKAAEKRIAKMSPELREVVSTLKDLSVLQAGVSETQINRSINRDMVLQAMAIIATENDTGISSSEIDAHLFKGAYNSEVIEDTKASIEFLNEAYNSIGEDERKEIFNKSRTVSLAYAAYKALEQGLDVQEFANRVVQFFMTSELYKKFSVYAKVGTAKKDNTKRRTEILLEGLSLK